MSRVISTYARAFLNVSRETMAEEHYSALCQNASRIVLDPSFFFLAKLPSLTEEKRHAIFLNGLLHNTSLCSNSASILSSFLRLVITNKRIEHLAAILQKAHRLFCEGEGIITVDLFAPSELSAVHLQQLTKALEKKYEKVPRVVFHKSSDLQAGMMIKVRDEVLRGSFKDKLFHFEKMMQK